MDIIQKTNPFSTNLLRQVSSETVRRPAGFYSSMAVDALAVLAACAFGYFYRGYVGDAYGIWLTIGVASFYALASLFSTVLARSFGRRAFIIALEIAGFFVFFRDTEFTTLLALGGIMLVYVLWGAAMARFELRNTMRIRFVKVARIYLSKFATGLLLALVSLYFLYSGAGELFIPRPAFDAVFSWSAGFVSGLYHEVNLQGTFKNFIESAVRVELEGNRDFQSLDASEQNDYVARAVDAQIAALQDRFDFAVDATKNVEDVFYEFMSKLFDGWKTQFGSAFFLVWLGAVYLLIRSVATLFYYVLGLFALLIFEILIAMNFLAVMVENRGKELIDYHPRA